MPLTKNIHVPPYKLSLKPFVVFRWEACIICEVMIGLNSFCACMIIFKKSIIYDVSLLDTALLILTHKSSCHVGYVGTNANSHLRTAFTLFQLVPGGKDLRHLIMAPWALPKTYSSGFHLLIISILCNFRINSKYLSEVPSNVEMSSIRESLACSNRACCVAAKVQVVSFCVCCWLCSQSIHELFIVIIHCTNNVFIPKSHFQNHVRMGCYYHH